MSLFRQGKADFNSDFTFVRPVTRPSLKNTFFHSNYP